MPFPFPLPDPSALAGVPMEQLPSVLTKLAALQTAVAARLAMAEQLDERPDTYEGDHLLALEEAARRLAVTEDWLRRRSQLPFVVKLSDGVVRYSAAGITAFIAERLRK